MRGARTACLIMALLGGCSDDPPPSEPSPAVSHEEAETAQLVAREYCSRVCTRAKTCDDDFDRQTCERQCQAESGIVVNLNPALAPAFYECVDDTSCSSVGNRRFVAGCLANAAEDVDLPKQGEKLCKALEDAADECSFTDYSERACRTAIAAYADGALADAAVCAQKKCELIFPCLTATLTLPSELNGTPIGFTEGGLSSSGNARTVVEALFPRSADQAPTPTPEATTSTSSEPTSATADAEEASESDNEADACDECLTNQCGTQIDGCLATDACLELYGVLLQCLEDEQGVTSTATTCFSDYVDEHHPTNVESLTALTNLMDCLESADCSGHCS